MNEIQQLDAQIRKEVALKEYKGPDRVIYGEDKKNELDEARKFAPSFNVASGLATLDSCIDGFRKGQLIIVSGPPKQGKTAFCQTLTESFIKQGKKCLWFSYELSFEELFTKFPMNIMDFYLPNYMETGNLKWIEDRIIESKQKFGTEIVFIDHLDFLRDLEILKGVSLNLSAYVGGIVQKVKQMAIKHEMVIFLMSHIRKNKWTTNELPSSEELRDSGQIAQLADIVLMIIRRRADKTGEEIYERNEAFLGVMENRHNGKTKRIAIKLEGKRYEESDLIPNKKIDEWK